MNRREIIAAYGQAVRDFNAGLICQADLDKAEQLHEQVTDNE